MKYLPLIWRNLWRRKIRTIFTLACIFIAFLLFGLLMTIRAAFSLGVEMAGMDRLVLIHKVSLIMPLPVSYQARIARRSRRDGGHAQHAGSAACTRTRPTSSRRSPSSRKRTLPSIRSSVCRPTR